MTYYIKIIYIKAIELILLYILCPEIAAPAASRPIRLFNYFKNSYRSTRLDETNPTISISSRHKQWMTWETRRRVAPSATWSYPAQHGCTQHDAVAPSVTRSCLGEKTRRRTTPNKKEVASRIL